VLRKNSNAAAVGRIRGNVFVAGSQSIATQIFQPTRQRGLFIMNWATGTRAIESV
jgi:hypothetical protein